MGAGEEEEVETTEEAGQVVPEVAETKPATPTPGHLLANQIKVKGKAVGAPGTLTTPHKTHVDCIGNSDEELGRVPTVTTAHGGTLRARDQEITETLALPK